MTGTEVSILRGIDKKRSVIKGVTDVVVETYGMELVVLLIKEDPPADLGECAVLIADRHRSRQVNS